LINIMDYLAPRAKEIKDSLTHFMLNHSEIEARKPYDEIWCIGPEGDRYYADMDKVGMRMQAYLSECYSHFCTAFQPLLEGQPEEVLTKIAKTQEVITRTIEHRLTHSESSKQALHVALKAFEEQLDILKKIYGESPRFS